MRRVARGLLRALGPGEGPRALGNGREVILDIPEPGRLLLLLPLQSRPHHSAHRDGGQRRGRDHPREPRRAAQREPRCARGLHSDGLPAPHACLRRDPGAGGRERTGAPRASAPAPRGRDGARDRPRRRAGDRITQEELAQMLSRAARSSRPRLAACASAGFVGYTRGGKFSRSTAAPSPISWKGKTCLST